MKHTCSIKVRSYECDSNNHVNNATYLNYLEHARMRFLLDNGFNYEGLREKGYHLVVSKICIEYISQAFSQDELTIATWPVKTGRVKGVLDQEIIKENQAVAKAQITYAVISKEGRPAPLPDGWNLPG